ncbi:MAG: ATP-binding cassette domain-containing protein [Planctomycetota bacterium]|jgi:ATP-binding cassette subfamily F protein uup|nr:ATP-binding cassette domain-containing protein [Planctomycetota bacterium]MDA1200228.1 ATP-binding cassette domain-containing protein [Planctomycetota bacterium]
MPLISLDDVSIGFRGVAILDHVTKQIEGGERIGLLGRNGAGKTTLLKLLAGQIEPEAGTCVRASGSSVALLQQDVPDELTGTVREIVSAALAARVASGVLESWDVDPLVNKTIEPMGLDGAAEFSTLSAGRKRRVLLARAVVTEPDLLLLDEPTNHLDLEAIAWLERFLASWRGTLLFITHDRSFLRRLANRIWELDRGRLYDWSCDYDTFLVRKAEMLEAEEKQNTLFDKKLAQEEVWIRKGIKARRTRNEGRVRALEAMREERSRRRSVEGKATITIQEAARSGTLVCEAKKISFTYGDTPIVKDFSTTILRGDRVGIVGPNGAGKTTLLKLLLGRLGPQQGSIRTGTNLQIAFFDQLREQLDAERPILEQINEGSDFVEVDGKKRHVIGYLQDFLFSPERLRLPVKVLSGGERHRLLLAKLFTQPANLLVLDEPTNDLDLETLELLEERLAAFAGTVLVVSHDREFLDNVVSSVIVFEADGICEYVGGYRDWQQEATASPARKNQSAGPVPAKAMPSAADPPSAATIKKKLSYKDQRELDQLPSRIESLEEQVSKLHARLADPAFYQQPADVIAAEQRELKALEAGLAAAYERWATLEADATMGGAGS